MAEPSKKALGEELPPFSFSKKPIKSTLPASAIPHNIDQTFSHVTRPVDLPSFNNINYDDQIRAPRMSLTTYYTYLPELPRPFTDLKKDPGVLPRSRDDLFSQHSPYDPSTEDHLRNLLRAGPGGLHENPNIDTEYRPATVDINQPTRRNLEPVKKKWGLSGGDILSLEGPQYPEHPEHPELMRAMDNLNANVTLEERSADIDPQYKPSIPGRNRQYAVGDGPAIQQVYTQKKPLCLPAVLRPPQEFYRINEEDFLHDLSPEEAPISARLGEFPFEVPKEQAEYTRAEPTHEHWRPNNSSDHCMNCFEGFRGFFNPQKRGRHHCRFCGLLYCHNCLHKTRETPLFEIAPPEGKPSTRANSGSSNASSVISGISTVSSNVSDEGVDGVMLDPRARLVVPIFKNLMEQGQGVGSLQEKFKVCKVCKTCGQNSQRLVYVLNQRSRSKNDIHTPYVFIENPYLGDDSPSQPHPLYDLKGVMNKPGFKPEGVSERRRLSYNNVPSDWTWSSF